MSKTVLIDIDDTIENLCETWVDWLNKQYGTSVKYNEITEWDMSKFFPNLTKEQVFEPLRNPKLWDYVQPKPGAVEYVKKLIDEGYNVYLCTTTDYRNVRPKFENVIQKHFPYINWNQVIIASRKQMINEMFLLTMEYITLKTEIISKYFLRLLTIVNMMPLQMVCIVWIIGSKPIVK